MKVLMCEIIMVPPGGWGVKMESSDSGSIKVSQQYFQVFTLQLFYI